MVAPTIPHFVRVKLSDMPALAGFYRKQEKSLCRSRRGAEILFRLSVASFMHQLLGRASAYQLRH